MNIRGAIRNPKKFQAKLDKRQRLLDRIKDAVFENLITVLVDKFDGELAAESRDAAALQLIRGGVLGGSRKLARHTGSVFKQHEQTGEPIHKFDERSCKEVIATVMKVMDVLEDAEEITVSTTWRGVTVKLGGTSVLDTSQLVPFLEFTDEFGSDLDDRYDPRNCVRSGRAKVDTIIMNF